MEVKVEVEEEEEVMAEEEKKEEGRRWGRWMRG